MMVSVILAFLVTMLLQLDEWKSFEGGFWGYQRSLYKQSQPIFQNNNDSSVRHGQEGKEVAITTSNCSDKLSSPTSTSSATNVVLDWSVLEKEKGDGPRVNLCRIPSYNMATEDPAGESFPFHVAYQCAGEEYDRFGEQLQRLVKVYSLSDAVRKEAWGQKPVPLPANTSVLAFGNSHTKQMISAWICQYFDQVTSYQAIRSDRAFSVRFENNSTLTLLRHSDLDGATEMRPWLGRPMTSFDAVIVGQLNPEKNGYRWAALPLTTIRRRSRRNGHPSHKPMGIVATCTMSRQPFLDPLSFRAILGNTTWNEPFPFRKVWNG